MGEVWKAQRNGQFYALKFIREETERDPQKVKEYVKRMELEWRALARIDHPNVVKSVELNLENRPPFLVLEWLDGKPLSEIYNGPGRRPSPSSTIAFVVDALRGLECAHEVGIVHRDIKPSNLFLNEGRVKLIDFGIAAAGDATRVTRTDAVAGSLPYFAPERISRPGERASTQCDVYAMGITLYELLVGELPFSSRNAGELMMMHLHTTMPDIRLKDPSTPAELADIVECATRKDPVDRYRDAGQFLEALETFAARHQVVIPPEPVTQPRVDGRVIASEAAFAQALTEDEKLCATLIADRRAQRRLHGWLSSVGGPAHTVAFKHLMESVRDSGEEPWRIQERVIHFFDPNRPIAIGAREIKVTGNVAYIEREALTALDEALPRLAPDEIERIGWTLVLALEARMPARATSFRKLTAADVIELCWQRDPRRGFRARDRSSLGTLQEVALHFLRHPDSYDDVLLSAERGAFLTRIAPGHPIVSLKDLAYAAFDAEADKEIRFEALVPGEDEYTLRFAMDRSLTRFLQGAGLRPGIAKPLQGAVECISLPRNEIPAVCRALPTEVARQLEGTVWEALGAPRDPPAGWWSFQQALARATREVVSADHVGRRVPTAHVSPRRRWRDLLAGAGLGAAGVLLFILGARLGLPGTAAHDASVASAPPAEASAAIPSASTLDVKNPPHAEAAPKSLARGRDTSAVSVARPMIPAPAAIGAHPHTNGRPDTTGSSGFVIKLPAEAAVAQQNGGAEKVSDVAQPALPLPEELLNPPPPSASSTAGGGARYEVKKEIVHDSKTGLTWLRHLSPERLTAAEAKTWCTSRGWRLPTKDELLSILEKSHQPMLDTMAFPFALVTLWTDSSDANGWQMSVNLRDGSAEGIGASPMYFYAGCVR
jgi:hypothetical protein